MKGVKKMKRYFLVAAMFVLLSGITVLAQAAGEDKSKEWPYGPYDKLHGAGRVGTGETLHFISPAEANQNQIVGKWAADNRTKGGLGAMLIFGDDGVVTSIFGALVDCKYVVEGQTIKMTFPDTAEQTAEPYSIVGDKLIAYPADPDKREERTRVGTAKPSVPPIVGVWSFKHYTGEMATMQYTSSSLAQLSVPMKTLKGQYKLLAQVLTMLFDGQPISNRTVQLSGDHLSFLADGADPEQKFTRVSP
jgi:hypothetical protein